MIKNVYKFYLAMQGYKVIYSDDYFIVSYDIINKRYILWYIISKFRLRFFDACDSSLEAKFKWKILMHRG